MLASEHCTDSLYDSQYHSVKMANNYSFKQESELILDDESPTTITNTTLTTSPSPQPSSGMISNQPIQNQLSQPSWYQQQQQQQQPHSTSGTSNNYPADEMYYASLPPPPPTTPLFTFPSPLPKKKQLSNRSHPRHHSANGILQQYAHYHYPQQQQSIPTQSLQRQASSSTTGGNTTLPSVYTVPSSTTICTASNPHYSSTTSQSSSSPTESTLSSLSPTSALKQPQHDGTLETSSSLPSLATPLRYQISLQAATAAAQRFGEPSSLTYLNRGQPYGLHFQDQHYRGQSTPKNTIITSTISITFHDATHRQASQNYWRFWLSQQDRPNEARAIDLDTQQSSGLVNVQYPSFDRITIQWEPHAGATLFVRFNCLSTDFSRIKGVKGIPLRAYIETTADIAPSSSSSSTASNTDGYEKYTEKSFCKIKLFRDKGAERKNKDDAKQIAKQLEKLKAEKNPQHNPLWQFYNRPQLPYSLFEPLPEEDDLIKTDFPLVSSASITTAPVPPLPIPTVASSIATTLPSYGLPPPSYSSTSSSMLSPSSSILSNTVMSPSQSFPHGRSNYQLLQEQQQHDNNMTIMSSFYPPTFSYPSHFVQPTHTTSPFVYNPVTSPSLAPSALGYQQQQQQQQSWSATSTISPVLGMKRSRSHVMTPTLDQPSPPEDQPSTKKHRGTTPALTLFVDTKKNASSSSSTTTTSTSMDLKEIKLQTLTVRQLIVKLSEIFSLQAQSVTEVLWRRDPAGSDNHHHALELQQQKKLGSTHSSASNVLVLVEDNVLEHFPDQTVMTVQWEISSSGMVRFILEF